MRDLTVFDVSLDQLAEFFSWLRNRVPSSRGTEIVRLVAETTPRSERTLKTRKVLVCAFYRFYALREPRSETLAVLGGLARKWGSQIPIVEEQSRISAWREPRRARPKTVTDEQVVMLLDACLTQRDRFLIHLLDQSGLRIGEALGLRHEDLSLRRKLVHVVPRTDNANGARAKGLKHRHVPVPDSVFDIYARYWRTNTVTLKVIMYLSTFAVTGALLKPSQVLTRCFAGSADAPASTSHRR